jgi:hypothetical protein
MIGSLGIGLNPRIIRALVPRIIRAIVVDIVSIRKRLKQSSPHISPIHIEQVYHPHKNVLYLNLKNNVWGLAFISPRFSA